MVLVQKTLSMQFFFPLKYNLNYSYSVLNKLIFGSVQAEAPIVCLHPAWRVSHHYDNAFLHCFLNECYN